MERNLRILLGAIVAVALASPGLAAVIVDDMTMHLTDQEVLDRDAGHSGVNAAGLVAEGTRLGGGDPGQWWFSPVRGLGFDTRKSRDNAFWNMSTGGNGAGLYSLTLGGVNTQGSDRGIDVSLVGGGGDEPIADIDDFIGSLTVDFLVTADDVDGDGNIRFHAATGAGNGQNATIGDVGDARTGTATLELVTPLAPTDSMTMHLTDQEVLDRNAAHSGRDAAALVAAGAGLGGGDPGQWWFSPVRGLGFENDRGGDRDNAEWDMSTDGQGPGNYILVVGSVFAPRDQDRGIDLLLKKGTGPDELISDLDGAGTFIIDVTVAADDIDGNGNVRFRAVSIGSANGVIGDLGNNWTGTADLLFVVPEPATLGLLAIGAAALLRRRKA